MSNPYRVAVENEGCGECLHGRTWWVIGPDEVASSTSYEEEDDAQHLADNLNSAFALGAASRQLPVEWKSFESETPANYVDVFVWDSQCNTCTSVLFSSTYYTPEKLKELQYTHWLPRDVIKAPDIPVSKAPAESAHEAPVEWKSFAEATQPAPAPVSEVRDDDFWDNVPF